MWPFFPFSVTGKVYGEDDTCRKSEQYFDDHVRFLEWTIRNNECSGRNNCEFDKADINSHDWEIFQEK